MIFLQLEQQADEGDIELLCGVIMPDHFHIVFRLGSRLSLGQVVAKFKSKTKSVTQWQEGYYEHRIRPDEVEENYAFYVFMNPYVGELCGLKEQWRWWRRWRPVPYDFEALLGDRGSIPSEWIKKEKSIRSALSVDS